MKKGIKKMKINYFDFGLYKGVELSWITREVLPSLGVKEYSAYGFEACKKYADNVSADFLDLENVKINNVAISDKEGTTKLYYSPNNLGHSIFSTKNNVIQEEYEEVETIRFSKWIKDNEIDLENSFNIVKVNIEGAEWHLFNDLVNSDMIKHIDVWCGAGHDVEKVEELHSVVDKYYKLLKSNNIKILRYTEYMPYKNVDIRKIIFLKYMMKNYSANKKFNLSEDRIVWE